MVLGVLAPIAIAAPKAFSTPIMLVTDANSSNKFGPYLGEILRAEGLNYFDTKDLSALSASDLSTHDITILAQTSTLNSTQVSMFTNYVNSGGRLLAMRPDSQIASLFGLNTPVGTLTNKYLAINATASVSGTIPGQGLPTSALQIHGSADEYTLAVGAVMIAQLYSNDTTGTSYPAVVSNNNGNAMAFTYDLASNVIYTRQGNPANANVDVDCDGTFRTTDLFQTYTGVCPSSVPYPSLWVDRNKIPVPQADEQQRLFARVIGSMLHNVLPMPQLWYFPGTAKSMLILTGDAHANPDAYYTYEMDSVNTHHGQISLFLSQASNPTGTDLQSWIATYGDSFGIHPYQSNPDFDPPITNLTEGFYDVNQWWDTLNVTRSNATRIHRLAWQDWTTPVELEVSYTLGMDTSFYHYGQWLTDGTNWPHGYITGSGRPMKFAKDDGTILPVYQQATQLVDEQLIYDINQSEGVTLEELDWSHALTVSQSLINSSLATDYTAITTMFHVDYYAFGNVQPWAEGTMDYAYNKGIPIWNADQWLNFTQARDATTLSNFSWSPYTLNFSANSSTALTIIVPSNFNSHPIQSVTMDGSTPVSYTNQTIKGVSVAFFTAAAGTHTYNVTYALATAAKLEDFRARFDSDQMGWLTMIGLAGMIVGSIALARLWRGQDERMINGK